jgi:hypothetical protein
VPRLIFLLLLLALSAGPAAAQDWVEYRPPGGGYRVEFPGKPQVSTRDVTTRTAIVQMNMALVERGDAAAFLTIHSLRPPGASGVDPQQVLDQVRDGVLKDPERKLREEAHTTVGGLPARRVIIDIPDKKQVSVALFVLGADRLYQAIVVVSPGQESSADVERFLKSFTVME